jgi:SsrA-binding protein
MTIIKNRKVYHEYFVEEENEAGLVLQGWEAKSIQEAKVSLAEAYISVIGDELYLVGCHVSPLKTISTHVKAEPLRERKLLMHRHEIDKLIGKVNIAGYTLMPVDFHYANGRIKVTVGLCKGKKLHDKRAALKEKEQNREAQRAMKGQE